MHEYEVLCDLIGEIHDTALDPARWTDVLAGITHFAGGQACGLLSKDPVSKSGTIHYPVDFDPHYVRTYAETYAQFDPLVTLPRLGQIVSIPDLVSYDEYRQGRFSQEWLRPQGWVDVAHVVLENSGSDRAIVLVVIPSQKSGMVGDELRRRLALIAPHARRALLIGKAIDLKQSEVETLNDLSAAMFLVDAGGRIVHANAAGHDMLYAGDLLRSVDGRLVARDAQVNQVLREICAACANGDAGIGAKAIALFLVAHDGERYVAQVLPLASGTRRSTGLVYMAVAAVFVRKAEPIPFGAHRRDLDLRPDKAGPAV